jgi:asparagine synthase (glutamine-hydrolysing)
MGTTLLRDPERWVEGGGTAVRGRAFAGDRLLDADALHDRFVGVAGLDDLVDRLEGLNGAFAVVHDRGDEALAAVDHLASIPLYYATETLAVGDDGHAVADRLERDRRDPVAAAELLLSRYVTGRDTLRTTLKTVRMGEAVRLRRADGAVSVDARRHYRYHPHPARDPPMAPSGSPLERFDAAVRAATGRLATVADGRPIAVPLSGGVDSRLVLAALVDAGYDDVRAFSFGREWNEDVRAAERIADALGVPWEFVEYTADRWRDWFTSPERRAFYRESFHHSRLPNYGVCPAVRHLVESGALPRDTVFCPGQTVTGISEVVPELLDAVGDDPARADVVDFVVDHNFSLWRWENETFDRVVRRRVADAIGHRTIDSRAAAAAAFEEWEWQEHMKYNLGGARGYEFHGGDWWFPLWDREVTAAWASLPLSLRRNKRLQYDYVRRRTAALADRSPGELPRTSDARRESEPSTVDRLRRAVARSPLDSVVAPLYWRLADHPYEKDPLGWYGIVPEELFGEVYTGVGNVHSLQTLEAAGYVSYDPPAVHTPPRNGAVRLPVPDPA